jgi:hypothetical protein
MLRYVILVLALSTSVYAESFEPPCRLPFADIATRREFDDQCGIDGLGANEKKLLQNRVKNRFCAEGEPIFTTFKSYRELQKLVEKPDVLGPKYGVPESREKLEKIKYVTSEGDELGEGKVVMVAAWVFKAHFSNANSGGEDVNCKLNGRYNNDLHIDLMQNKGTDKCQSITAEISPHYRPAIWAELAAKDKIKHPVRITGQLFFDASHKPCRGDKKPTPNRVSSWEIHPVYNVEVCKFATIVKCDAKKDANWTTVEEYLYRDTESEDETEDADS